MTKRCPSGKLRVHGKCLNKNDYTYATNILKHNPIHVNEVKYYNGSGKAKKQNPHGINNKVWKEAWKEAETKGYLKISEHYGW